MVDTIHSSEFGRDDFNQNYYRSNEKKPVLLKDEVAGWEAARKWNPEYLDRVLGHRKVRVNFLKEDVLSLNHPEKVKEKTLPFSEARRYICEDGNYYLAQATIEYPLTTRIVTGESGEFSELVGDIQRPRYLADFTKQCYVTNLWFGGDRCKTPLHYDDKENFFSQIFGKKRFLLFSPSQTDRLYQSHGETYSHLSRVNVFDPDESKFPRFKDAEGSEVVVEPGDMLYIPKGWWHAVETLSTSISVNSWWTGLVRHVSEELNLLSDRVGPALRTFTNNHPSDGKGG